MSTFNFFNQSWNQFNIMYTCTITSAVRNQFEMCTICLYFVNLYTMEIEMSISALMLKVLSTTYDHYNTKPCLTVQMYLKLVLTAQMYTKQILTVQVYIIPIMSVQMYSNLFWQYKFYYEQDKCTQNQVLFTTSFNSINIHKISFDNTNVYKSVLTLQMYTNLVLAVQMYTNDKSSFNSTNVQNTIFNSTNVH